MTLLRKTALGLDQGRRLVRTPLTTRRNAIHSKLLEIE